MFPLDDGAVNRIAHLHVPWTASGRASVCGPATRCTRSPDRTSPAGSACSPRSPDPSPAPGARCCANKGTGSPAGPGTSPPARSGGASPAVMGHAWRPLGSPAAPGARGAGERSPTASSPCRSPRTATEIGGADLGVSIPLAWSPDGAFLTVGYGRPFPVSEDYEPPAAAPTSFARHRDHRRSCACIRSRRRARPHPPAPVADPSTAGIGPTSPVTYSSGRSRALVCEKPADTTCQRVSVPTWTGVGVGVNVWVPIPSWPMVLSPRRCRGRGHHTCGSCRRSRCCSRWRCRCRHGEPGAEGAVADLPGVARAPAPQRAVAAHGARVLPPGRHRTPAPCRSSPGEVAGSSVPSPRRPVPLEPQHPQRLIAADAARVCICLPTPSAMSRCRPAPG